MSDSIPQSVSASRPAPWPWRGVLALVCMFAHAMVGYPLLPSSYYNDFEGYVPVFVLLALSVGFGLGALHRVAERTE